MTDQGFIQQLFRAGKIVFFPEASDLSLKGGNIVCFFIEKFIPAFYRKIMRTLGKILPPFVFN